MPCKHVGIGIREKMMHRTYSTQSTVKIDNTVVGIFVVGQKQCCLSNFVRCSETREGNTLDDFLPKGFGKS
jgi:hypothetical protein